MSNTALTHFQHKKLQPTSFWGQAKKDCITEFGHTHIFVCSSFSNIIYWDGGRQWHVTKRYGLEEEDKNSERDKEKERDRKCMLFGETWCLKSKARAMVIKIDKQHLLQIKKLATQRKCHKEKQQRPQHAAVLLPLLVQQNLFLCSHFLSFRSRFSF